MPWDQGQKRFIRSNPDYSGATVWQEDMAASIKIVASRHDDHDQDLADGISRCLNIDGFNGMAANLDMDGFRVINVAPGGSNTDAANYGQIISNATFNQGTRTLSLTTYAGTAIDVVIPATGAGVGSVEQVDIGEGLDGTVNPITVSGDIRLATIGVAQTFSGGINSITIDKHGRVTQVNTGSMGGTNLTATYQSATVTIASSTGNNVPLSAASTSQAGIMSASDKTLLTSLGTYQTGSTQPIKTTGIFVGSQFKANGPVKHKLGTSVAINVASASRHRVVNNGATTLTFSGLPSADDPDLGSSYQLEGTVMVVNGATPGAVTIAGVTPTQVMGSPSVVPNEVSVMSYLIARTGGANTVVLMWSIP